MNQAVPRVRFGIAVYLLMIANTAAQEVGMFAVPAGERQLFLDDAAIAEKDGLHWWRLGTSDMVAYTVVYDPTEANPSRRYKSVSPRRDAGRCGVDTRSYRGDPCLEPRPYQRRFVDLRTVFG